MSNEEKSYSFLFAAVLAAGGVEAQEAVDSMKNFFIAVGIVMSICRFGTIGRRWSVS